MMEEHRVLKEEQHPNPRRPWIRGVNLGGWLVLERFITPYLFAITSCHLDGNFCFYPHQIDAPPKESPSYKLCDDTCKPILEERNTGQVEFPIDEYTLLDSFKDKDVAKRFLQFHWDNFVTHDDIQKLAAAGVTHVRVPLPHWIMGDIETDEPWVDGGWMYFIRLVSWCRKYRINVWPDLHTAPGSQNGFDNSGQYLGGAANPTGVHWCNSKQNVNRTLQAVQDISNAIVRDGLDDVVTGFGTLNEPFKDCDRDVIEDYNTQALHIVRSTLSKDTAVYMGDLFNATVWNNGWWDDEDNTYIDSHYYHVFDEHPRHLSPRQHIAFVCQKQHRDTTSCCYEDYPQNTVPSEGVSRIIGEWSAAFDTLVDAQLDRVMKGIAANGTAPFMDRLIEPERQAFLKNFVEAQMVTYEAVEEGVSSGWFYWTLKTEGGAFAEWDFLRGVQEGWIPPIPHSNVSSLDLYGSCYDIMFQTDDNYTIVHEYPDATSLDPDNWQGVDIDDDIVVSHGQSLHGEHYDGDQEEQQHETTTASETKTTSGKDFAAQDSADNGFKPNEITSPSTAPTHHHRHFWPLIMLLFFMFAIKYVFFTDRRRRIDYTEVSQDGAPRHFNV